MTKIVESRRRLHIGKKASVSKDNSAGLISRSKVPLHRRHLHPQHHTMGYIFIYLSFFFLFQKRFSRENIH